MTGNSVFKHKINGSLFNTMKIFVIDWLSIELNAKNCEPEKENNTRKFSYAVVCAMMIVIHIYK